MKKPKFMHSSHENLYFAMACFCLFLAILTGIWSFTVYTMCKDLNNVVAMQKTYINELEEQKERLGHDAAYCIELEQKYNNEEDIYESND